MVRPDMPRRDSSRQESPSRIAIRALLDEGLTIRQIAETLRISPQAVRKHLAKMRRGGESERKAS